MALSRAQTIKSTGRGPFGRGTSARSASQTIRGIAAARSAASGGGFGSVARTNSSFGKAMSAANKAKSRAGGSKG